jgi:hypothetical protein
MVDSERAPSSAAAPLAAHGPGLSLSLRWFLAEFLVVVAGILVALALSSWAQGRQDIAREQSWLRQLQADLVKNEGAFAEAVAFVDERAVASARVLHRFWRDSAVADEAAVLDLMLPRSTRRFRPVLGTAEALISSGELNLIRSDAVRAAILDYVESMRTNLEDVSRYDETYYRPGVDMLFRGPELYQHAIFRSNDDRLRPRPNHVERVPFPAVLDDMLRDRVVYDGYTFLLIAHRNQGARYGEMLTRTQALRTQIQETTELQALDRS